MSHGSIVIHFNVNDMDFSQLDLTIFKSGLQAAHYRCKRVGCRQQSSSWKKPSDGVRRRHQRHSFRLIRDHTFKIKKAWIKTWETASLTSSRRGETERQTEHSDFQALNILALSNVIITCVSSLIRYLLIFFFLTNCCPSHLSLSEKLRSGNFI